MSQVQTEEQQQINIINQLSRLESQYAKAEQTIILYDLFDTPQATSIADSTYLHNLHTVAQLLVDSSVQVAVE